MLQSILSIIAVLLPVAVDWWQGRDREAKRAEELRLAIIGGDAAAVSAAIDGMLTKAADRGK